MKTPEATVIGAGLAGCEAAARLAVSGLNIRLYEMKPEKFSPAHSMPDFAELVCSNSFRSDDPLSAVGLLKEEMRRMGSLLMEAAEKTRVPAGKALAVDRLRFARYATKYIESLPNITVIRHEAVSFDPGGITVLATGPLTSEAMAAELAQLVGDEYLYFYDAIAPIVTAESINMDIAFVASRYGPAGEGDYINCPMTREQYDTFYHALMTAEKTALREFEKPTFFEGCLPVEVMAERGPQTLTFGPMKPVGLDDPRTGRRPYAVVQLRKENTEGTLYNLVGFQTRLKRPEQDRIFRLIPGLENAEFARWGSIHRNTFLHSPAHLNAHLQIKARPEIFVAGQLSGVEGYVESAAMGILAGENAARLALGRELLTPPPTTAAGALVTHLTDQTERRFQPSNINFGLLPTAPRNIPKKERAVFYNQRALKDLDEWLTSTGYVNRDSV